MFAHMHTHPAEYIQCSMYIWDFSNSFVSFCQAVPSLFLWSLHFSTHTQRTCHSYIQAYFHIADNHILMINSFHSLFRMWYSVLSSLCSSPLTSPEILIWLIFFFATLVQDEEINSGCRLQSPVSGDFPGLRNQTESEHTCMFWAVWELLWGLLLLCFLLVPFRLQLTVASGKHLMWRI